MKYKAMEDTILGKATDKANDQDRDDEAESSQIRVERVFPIGSHRKRLAEHG